jgi:hypothetical protein
MQLLSIFKKLRFFFNQYILMVWLVCSWPASVIG